MEGKDKIARSAMGELIKENQLPPYCLLLKLSKIKIKTNIKIKIKIKISMKIKIKT